MRLVRFFSFFVFVALLAFACDTSPCEDSDGVMANLGFYKVKGSTIADTTFLKLKVYSMDTIDGELTNFLSTDYQSIFVPLSKNSDTTCYILQFDSVSFDTIQLSYTKVLKLESHECGFDFFFELTGVQATSNKIDSIWIRKPFIEYGDQENVKIYF